MSSQENTPMEEDPVLLPPPFGTTETAGEHLLPTATSMDDLFRYETESGAEEADFEDLEPKGTSAPGLAADVQPSPEARALRADARAPAAGSGERRMLWIGLVIFLVGGGLAWVFLRGSGAPTKGPSTAQTDAARGPTVRESSVTRAEEPSAAAESRPGPTDLAALRALSFERRHALLSRAEGDVPVELHIGLDLVQAAQSEHPCRTFADALSTIESAEDPGAFRWALEEAEAPAGDEAGCENLGARLSTLRDGPSVVTTPAGVSAPRPTSRSKKTRPTTGSSRSAPQPPPSSRTPEKPRAEPQPEPPPASNSIATKLDDGELRGLGD